MKWFATILICANVFSIILAEDCNKKVFNQSTEIYRERIHEYNRGFYNVEKTRKIDNFHIICKTYNPIDSLNSIDCGTNCYKEVTFEDSYIPSIPINYFQHNEFIEILYLNNCNISTIKTGAFNSLRAINEIHLAFNNIAKIPKGCFNHLTTLTKLNFSNNHLREIEEESFQGLEHLIELDLSNNLLVNLHENIFYDLYDLVNLNLENNQLTYFNVDLSKLKELQIINLSKNKLIQGMDFSRAKFLYELNLSNNFIRELNLSNFPENLSILLINNNNISNLIPDKNHVNRKLSTLNLSHNKIKLIPQRFFNNFNELDDLNLSYNNIEFLKFSSINGLKNVRILNLKSNNISELDVNLILVLKTLKILDLSENQLREFNLENVNNLEELFISVNNFSCAALEDFFLKSAIKNLKIVDEKKIKFHDGECKNDTGNLPEVIILDVLSKELNNLTEIVNSAWKNLSQKKEEYDQILEQHFINATEEFFNLNYINYQNISKMHVSEIEALKLLITKEFEKYNHNFTILNNKTASNFNFMKENEESDKYISKMHFFSIIFLQFLLLIVLLTSLLFISRKIKGKNEINNYNSQSILHEMPEIKV